MGKLVDLTGRVSGRLTVISFARRKKDELEWHCRCECGTETIVNGRSIRKGLSKSCGCFRKDKTMEMRTTHGQSKTRLYKIWLGMRARTGNPNEKIYKYYGGRGISICNEWSSYEGFRLWALESGYSGNLTIDRSNCDKNYCADNCRWVSIADQQRNRRNNKLDRDKAWSIFHDQRPNKDIAKTYGVSISSVQLIKRKRSWVCIHETNFNPEQRAANEQMAKRL
jgi:hypothetical protein